MEDAIARDLEVLDMFERGGEDGWNSDGDGGGNGKQADYGLGSFAIQYSQPLFVRFGMDIDLERRRSIVKRAGWLALDFLGYLDADGRYLYLLVRETADKLQERPPFAEASHTASQWLYIDPLLPSPRSLSQHRSPNSA